MDANRAGEIHYALHSERRIEAKQVRDLYDHAHWWPNRSVDEIADVLDASPAIGAWAGERLIGFARAVRDAHFRAYIEDILVHADFRRHGVASNLLSPLLAELADIETVSLFCNPEIASLYHAQGFRRHSQPEVVMHKRTPPEG